MHIWGHSITRYVEQITHCYQVNDCQVTCIKNILFNQGDRLCPLNHYWHHRIFRPSDGPESVQMRAGLAAFDSYFVSLFENESGSQVTKIVAYCGIMTSLESPLFTKRLPFIIEVPQIAFV